MARSIVNANSPIGRARANALVGIMLRLSLAVIFAVVLSLCSLAINRTKEVFKLGDGAVTHRATFDHFKSEKLGVGGSEVSARPADCRRSPGTGPGFDCDAAPTPEPPRQQEAVTVAPIIERHARPGRSQCRAVATTPAEPSTNRPIHPRAIGEVPFRCGGHLTIAEQTRQRPAGNRTPPLNVSRSWLL
jgi:hypothetical protein